MRGTISSLAIAFALLSSGAGAQSLRQPQLSLEAPPELAAVRAGFESENQARLAGIVELVGLEDPGPAIRISLVPESSSVARRFPRWIAGFALGASGEVVIFPGRSSGYPHNSLQDVLRHEVAHVLIARAAGGGSIPRWFNEGLAMAAERSWGFEDQTRLLYQLLLGPAASFGEIDNMFSGTQEDQRRAYALSGAFVRELIQRDGTAFPALLLARVKSGTPFDAAFSAVAGETLSQAESDFWQNQRIWTTWVPIVTSSVTLWMIVTVIALLAIRRRRQRDAAIQRKWEDEDSEP